MKKIVRYIGMDMHKESIVIAVADRGRAVAEVVATIGNDWLSLLEVLDRLGPASRLRLCYEAGPTGFDLARRLTDAGYHCVVVAPSLVPVQPGRRVKTDRRDARKLAHFLRSGDLVEVAIPERQTEALRDLERARDDAKNAERAARHQLDKFLLRQHRIWPGLSKWTCAHWTWLGQQEFAEEAQRRVRDDYILTVQQATARVERLTTDLADLVENSALRPLVKALMALRGVQLVTAVVIAAEIGDFRRFAHPSDLMSFLGLVPSVAASGESCRRGRITRTGNRHARRILIEAAWSYRFRPRGSKAIEARRRPVSAAVRSIAERAEQRLCRRYQRLVERGKPTQKVVTAVARELAGFVWAIAQQEKLLAA
jgi:transposase